MPTFAYWVSRLCVYIVWTNPHKPFTACANLFGAKERFQDMEILVEILVRCMDKSSSPHANGFGFDDVLLAIQSVCELNENRELLLQLDDFFPMMLDGVELALRNKDVDALDLCFSIFIQFTITQDQSRFLQSSNLVQVITKTVLPAHWWPDALKKTARALRFQLSVSVCTCFCVHALTPPSTATLTTRAL